MLAFSFGRAACASPLTTVRPRGPNRNGPNGPCEERDRLPHCPFFTSRLSFYPPDCEGHRPLKRNVPRFLTTDSSISELWEAHLAAFQVSGAGSPCMDAASSDHTCVRLITPPFTPGDFQFRSNEAFPRRGMRMRARAGIS